MALNARSHHSQEHKTTRNAPPNHSKNFGNIL